MTALAPVPGRESWPADEPETGTPGSDLTVLPGSNLRTTGPRAPDVPRDSTDLTETRAVSVGACDPGGGPVDLTFRRPQSSSNTAGQASWILGLALSLLAEGAAERVVMAELLAEAAGRSRALEGAYGRAVALLSEYPDDPLVHRTVDLLAKALLRSRRPNRAAEEA